MAEVAVAVLAGAWVVEALVLGYVMRRRGFDAYAWTLIGISLGPIALSVVLFATLHPPSREHGSHPLDLLSPGVITRATWPSAWPSTGSPVQSLTQVRERTVRYESVSGGNG